MTERFIESNLIEPLLDIEREYRASFLGRLASPPESSTGWKTPLTPGQYGLVTCGPRDKNRFYSNGLDLSEALTSDHFFQHVLNRLYKKLLLYPIPTVAAINGHAMAGGFCLVLAHDFRVMKDNEQKGRATMAMTEISFGAPIPAGLAAIVKTKLPSSNLVAKCLTEGHRFGAQESLESGIVHAIAPESEVVEKSLKLAFDRSIQASTGVYGMIKETMYEDAVKILDSTGGGNGDVHSIHVERLKQVGPTAYGKSKL